MPIIGLSGQYVTYVSDQDWPVLSKRSWWAQVNKHTGNVYAVSEERYYDQVLKCWRRRKIYMHRLITNCPSGWLVDHKDRNTLNNRRPNLRVTTGTFNNSNQGAHVDSLTGYRGVSLANKRFRARISVDGVEHYLGTYASAVEAARAYDRRAREAFGEFAWLNFDDRMDERDEFDISVVAAGAVGEEIPW